MMETPKPARELALHTFLQLNTGHGRARDIVNKIIHAQGLVDPDKSFLTELVYGTLRQRGKHDWVISQFILNWLPTVAGEGTPDEPTSAPTGLVAYWNFDERQGTVVHSDLTWV